MGAVAQLGEHLLCKQGVTGSIPVSSTRNQCSEELAATIRGLEMIGSVGEGRWSGVGN